MQRQKNQKKELSIEDSIATINRVLKAHLIKNLDEPLYNNYEAMYIIIYRLAVRNHSKDLYESLKSTLEEHCAQLAADIMRECEQAQPCQIISTKEKLAQLTQQYDLDVLQFLPDVTMYINRCYPEFCCATMAREVFERTVQHNEALIKILKQEQEIL